MLSSATPGARPDWLAGLRRRAQLPPSTPRGALLLGSPHVCIGSVECAVAERIVQAGLPMRAAGAQWQVIGPADASLAAIAQWLDRNGLGARWRGELLDVSCADGRRVAVIERAAVRALGIATFAVHLVGVRGDGRVWVQQRAFDKATDPGLWDTLMGGQVGAGESADDTLERETWEEAGLRTSHLRELAWVERIDVRRPVSEGYMVEQIDVFEGIVPGGVVPSNQDGEVHRFDCLAAGELSGQLAAGAFTLEAALILSAWLGRRGFLPS